jgi:hypothetical protein
VLELPGDLVGDGCRLVRSGQPGRFRGVSGCAKRMRAHVCDAGSLSSSPGGRRRRRGAHCMCGSTGNEAPANLTGGIKFTLSKRPSTSDCIAWSTVCRGLRLKDDQDALSTVRCPHCDEAAISFAQRLRGRHGSSFARWPTGSSFLATPKALEASYRFARLANPAAVEGEHRQIPKYAWKIERVTCCGFTCGTEE